MTAAIGAAIVIASLTQKVRDLESLMQPRTIVLWIPLVLTYWSVLGLRAAFRMPSELPAAVTFACHGPNDTHAYWSGVRGAMIAVLSVPVTFVAVIVTGLLVGWPIAAWHAAFVAGMVVTLVELTVLSMDRVPFTRRYAAGDGLLRKHWPLYLFGMLAFAYWPVRIELQLLGGGEPWLVAGAAGAAIVCHLVGRARARRWSVALDEPVSDGAMLSVLDIGAVVRPVPSRRSCRRLRQADPAPLPAPIPAPIPAPGPAPPEPDPALTTWVARNTFLVALFRAVMRTVSPRLAQ